MPQRDPNDPLAPHGRPASPWQSMLGHTANAIHRANPFKTHQRAISLLREDLALAARAADRPLFEATLQKLDLASKAGRAPFEAHKALAITVDTANAPLLTMLIERQAPVNFTLYDRVSPDFPPGTPPIHRAAGLNDTLILRLLIQHLPHSRAINALDPMGSTALMIAAVAGFAESASLLIAASPSLDNIRYDGESALTLAMPYLFEDNPLHAKEFAWDIRKRAPIVKALLAAGADPNIGSRSGFPPLAIALSARNAELAHLLLQHGANSEILFNPSSLPPEPNGSVWIDSMERVRPELLAQLRQSATTERLEAPKPSAPNPNHARAHPEPAAPLAEPARRPEARAILARKTTPRR